MAIVYETNSLGFKLKFDGPQTVEDYDRIGGKVGVCLEDAAYSTLFHHTLDEWRDAFAKKVEEMTGVKRLVNDEATANAKKKSKTPDKVKDVLETEKVYLNRVTANMSDEDKAALATLAQEVADTTPIDPSPSKRQGGIPKDCRVKAESLLTLPPDALEAKITQWGEAYATVDVTSIERGEDGRPTVDGLARMVKEILDAKRNEL